MTVYEEIAFEDEICEYRWLYAEADAVKYDRALAIFPPDVCLRGTASPCQAVKSSE